MTARIFLKLIFAVLCVLVVALTAVDYLSSRVAHDTYVQILARQLTDKARMLATVEEDSLTRLTPGFAAGLAKASAARLTVIDRSGSVMADSEAEASRMENHSSRQEVAEALHGRVGTAVRHSATIGVDFLYVAIPIRIGALRLAVPLKEIDHEVLAIRKRILASVALAFLPAILLAAFFARFVSSKLGRIIDYAGTLAQGNFQVRMRDHGSDELGTLSSKLNETGEKLQKMFEELQREHAELERMERIRKDFVINVSHELRTPLASIQGYTETLLDGALHDPAHNIRFLNIIRQNAERLGRLTSDLLTLSRIELKTQKFQFAAYYVNMLLQECVDSMLPMAEKKNIFINIEPAPEGTEVVCDSEAVHQILSNLLDNALKYAPEGSEITVSAKPLAAKDSFESVEIAVRDRGTGIPAEDLPRLFERFYRVDKARSRELGGTGLGLAIVKHLVRAQGGDVKVESVYREGSTFSFTLPVEDLGLESDAVQAQLTVP